VRRDVEGSMGWGWTYCGCVSEMYGGHRVVIGLTMCGFEGSVDTHLEPRRNSV
jgi:hypothetical protein